MASKPAYVWDGSAWQQIGPVVNSPIKFQTTAPASPSTGDVWVDSDGALDSLITNTGDFVSQSAFNSSVSSLSSSKANISGQVYTGTHNFTGAALSGAGLDIITTQTFTSQASITFNNCFSSLYQNYRIMMDLTASADSGLTMRLRSGGVDLTATNYHRQRLSASGATVAGSRDASQSSWTAQISMQTNLYTGATLDMFDPFNSSSWTSYVSANAYLDGGQATLYLSAGSYAANASVDGLTFSLTSGTFSGMIRIYGYRNA